MRARASLGTCPCDSHKSISGLIKLLLHFLLKFDTLDDISAPHLNIGIRRIQSSLSDVLNHLQ